MGVGVWYWRWATQSSRQSLSLTNKMIIRWTASFCNGVIASATSKEIFSFDFNDKSTEPKEEDQKEEEDDISIPRLPGYQQHQPSTRVGRKGISPSSNIKFYWGKSESSKARSNGEQLYASSQTPSWTQLSTSTKAQESPTHVPPCATILAIGIILEQFFDFVRQSSREGRCDEPMGS